MYKYFSPAKLNLFFRVLKKREDDFHEIASVFQAIGLGDHLEIEQAKEDALTCTNPALPTDQTNLILKATHLFRQKSGLSLYVRIHLHKQIPMQSGLGGGSSNAATTLWALNDLVGRPYTASQLMAWASSLGSDVPFFFSHGTAYCTGRGEQIQPLPFPGPKHVHIAKPDYGLSTPQVYNACTPQDGPVPITDFLKGEPHYFNDLEPAAFSLAPQLSAFKQTLIRAGLQHTTMTGSGTAFFGFGDNIDIPCIHTHFLARKEGKWY